MVLYMMEQIVIRDYIFQQDIVDLFGVMVFILNKIVQNQEQIIVVLQDIFLMAQIVIFSDYIFHQAGNLLYGIMLSI
jgi:hypothetical protein